MSLRKLRMGTLGVSAETPDAKAVRAARVTAARRHWQEIPRERLVARGPGWLVDAASDELFAPYRGLTFERGSARLIAEQKTLVFYLDPDSGEPLVLEPLQKTWSEVYAKQARRAARAGKSAEADSPSPFGAS